MTIKERNRMRTRYLITVVAVTLGTLGVSAVSASAATTTCAGNKGTIKLSPGLSQSPQVQNVTVNGTLSECSGEGSTVTGAKDLAHLKTAEPVTCSALTGA